MWWPMGKFFFNAADRVADHVAIAGQNAHHMLHVLRFKIGTTVILCDSASTDYTATLEKLSDKPATLTFLLSNPTHALTEPPFPITLYQGLPKGDKMEWIIEKCVEVGVTKIVPVITARTISKSKDTIKKLERYNRIAESAACQSMRGTIPQVDAPIAMAEALKHHTKGITLVAYENECQRTIKAALQNISPQPISIWIGPEGGFDETEIQKLATEINATPVSLGARILRTETSGIVAISNIQSAWEGQI